MPRVPLSQGPEQRSAPLQGGFQQQIDVSAPARQLARGLGDAAEVVSKIAERDAQDEAWRTQATINTDFVKWNAKEQEASRGQNAKGYAERTQQWWKDAAETYGKDLSPQAKRLISRNLLQSQVSAFEGATRHENGELERSRVEALDGSLQAEVSRGAAGGPNAAAASVSAIQNNLREYAASTGKPAEWVAAQELKYTTSLHANVIASLMQNDPAAAKTYFESNRGQIDGTRHDEIGKGINATSAANDGEKAADEAWKTMGPKGYNDPVALDKMEARLRETYANDPTRRQASIAALRERARAGDFAALAREHSRGASAAQGGDIAGQLVTEDEDQAGMGHHGIVSPFQSKNPPVSAGVRRSSTASRFSAATAGVTVGCPPA
jgi:hypothetical protein